MGERARLNAWGLRLGFVALIAAGVALQLRANATSGAHDLLAPARTVLEQAGYRVDPLQRDSWLNGTLRGGAYLRARHAGCAQAIVVRSRPIMGRFDLPQDMAAGGAAQFVYGDTQSASAPSRLRLLTGEAWMQTRYVLTFGRVGRPVPALLVIADPSACLAITAPDWRSIWYG